MVLNESLFGKLLTVQSSTYYIVLKSLSCVVVVNYFFNKCYDTSPRIDVALSVGHTTTPTTQSQQHNTGTPTAKSQQHKPNNTTSEHQQHNINNTTSATQHQQHNISNTTSTTQHQQHNTNITTESPQHQQHNRKPTTPTTDCDFPIKCNRSGVRVVFKLEF